MTQTVQNALVDATYSRVVTHIYSLTFQMNHCCVALLKSNTQALCNAQQRVTYVTCSNELTSRGVLFSNLYVLALELFTTSLLGNYSERLLGCNIILLLRIYTP